MIDLYKGTFTNFDSTMAYTVEFNESTPMCKVSVTGKMVSPQDPRSLRQAAINLNKQYDCDRFLFDMTQVEIVSSTLDAYTMATPQGEEAERLRKLKAAILYRRITQHEHFFETVAINRGFRIKVFDKRAEALVWLSN
jgi:hypothetical protein